MKILKYKCLLLCLFFIQLANAQETSFKGMVFRSQIFDSNNLTVKDEDLSLQVELFSQKDIWYSEEQLVHSNSDGLIFIQVGTGNKIVGDFKDVPFSSSEINLRIKYKIVNSSSRNSSDYIELKSTELFAVPYAMHALTAGSVVNSSQSFDKKGISSMSKAESNDSNLASKGNTWSVYGNRDINMRGGFLGTVDAAPLDLKTNNNTRINISKDGKVNILGDIEIGAPYKTKISNLIADNISFGTTTIDDTRDSSSPSIGAFIVKGGVGIGKNLNIGGNTKIDKDAVILGNVGIGGKTAITNSSTSTNSTNGALVVSGGVGFGQNLNVKDDINIGGIASIAGKTSVTSGLSSTNYASGALVVSGGVGIGENVNVGKNAIITGDIHTNQNLIVSGVTASSNKDTGALVVENGGLGVEGDVNIGGNINIVKDAGITGNLSIGKKLDVIGNLEVKGNTKIFGAIEASSLELTNPLTLNSAINSLDKDTGALILTNGGMGIERNLNVGEDIKVGKSLVVSGDSNLVGKLAVSGVTTLDGDLISKGVSTFNKKPSFNDGIYVRNSTNDVNVLTLDVAGKGYISGETQIKGDLKLLSKTNPSPGNFTSAAALEVAGGGSIAGNLNVNGDVRVGGTINSTSAGGVTAKGPVSVDIVTYYRDPYKIALLNGKGYGSSLNMESYAMKVDGVDQGLAIRLNKAGTTLVGKTGKVKASDETINSDNKYINFLDTNNVVKGSISGQTIEEYKASWDYKDREAGYNEQIIGKDRLERVVEYSTEDLNRSNESFGIGKGLYAKSVVLEGLEGAKAAVATASSLAHGVIAAQETLQASADPTEAPYSGVKAIQHTTLFTSFGASAISLGTSAASFAVKLTLEKDLLNLQEAGIVTETKSLEDLKLLLEKIINPSLLRTKRQNDDRLASVGVTYGSGNADYAEYLELSNHDQAKVIGWGQLVGVKNGKISYNTDNAEKVMVVSQAAAVIGNMQSSDKMPFYKAVAFLGQVPVYVLGKTEVGDYILPSGNNDGYAISKSVSELVLDDYSKIVGTAWQSSAGLGINEGGALINVAVGLNSNDLVNVLKNESAKINSLAVRLDAVEKYINAPKHKTEKRIELLADLTEKQNKSLAIIEGRKQKGDDVIQKLKDKILKSDDKQTQLIAISQVIEEKYDNSLCDLKNPSLYIDKEVESMYANVDLNKLIEEGKMTTNDVLYLEVYKKALSAALMDRLVYSYK